MISPEVDLVAGDLMVQRGDVVAETTSVPFYEAYMDSISPTAPGPHHCGDLDPFRTIGQTSADFSNHLALNAFRK